MKNALLITSLILLLPNLPATAAQAERHYKVIHIVDGDTFDATDGHITFRVRVAGMDAPESKQKFGERATSKLRELIAGKDIVIQPVGRGVDRYNRILGQVFVAGKDLSLIMIEQGYAFYYRPQCQNYPQNKRLYQYDPQAYVKAEAEAKSKHLVIWSDGSSMLPCQFRKDHPRD